MDITVTVKCRHCGKTTKETPTESARELLRQILHKAHIQEGDVAYREIMDRVIFPDE